MLEAFEKWRDEQKISGRSYKADERVWRAAYKSMLEASKQFDYTGLTEVIIEELSGE